MGLFEKQFSDVMEEKTDLSKAQIREQIAELLQMVKIDLAQLEKAATG